jgi:hypothetical protein
MTAPTTSPRVSAETASLIRPVAAWAAIPASGKLTKPAVHHSQLLTLKRRGIVPTARLTNYPRWWRHWLANAGDRPA